MHNAIPFKQITPATVKLRSLNNSRIKCLHTVWNVHALVTFVLNFDSNI